MVAQLGRSDAIKHLCVAELSSCTPLARAVRCAKRGEVSQEDKNIQANRRVCKCLFLDKLAWNLRSDVWGNRGA